MKASTKFALRPIAGRDSERVSQSERRFLGAEAGLRLFPLNKNH